MNIIVHGCYRTERMPGSNYCFQAFSLLQASCVEHYASMMNIGANLNKSAKQAHLSSISSAEARQVCE